MNVMHILNDIIHNWRISLMTYRYYYLEYPQHGVGPRNLPLLIHQQDGLNAILCAYVYVIEHLSNNGMNGINYQFLPEVFGKITFILVKKLRCFFINTYHTGLSSFFSPFSSFSSNEENGEKADDKHEKLFFSSTQKLIINHRTKREKNRKRKI